MGQRRLPVAEGEERSVADESDVGREETRLLQCSGRLFDCGHDAGAPSSVC